MAKTLERVLMDEIRGSFITYLMPYCYLSYLLFGIFIICLLIIYPLLNGQLLFGPYYSLHYYSDHYYLVASLYNIWFVINRCSFYIISS